MKIALFINPNSGKRCYQHLAEHPAAAMHFVIHSPLLETEWYVQQALEGGCTVFAVHGGDGTLSNIYTALKAVCTRCNIPMPYVLPLGGGSVQATRKSLGIHRLSPDELLTWASQLESVDPKNNTDAYPLLRIESGNEVRYGLQVMWGIPQRVTKLVTSGHKNPFYILLKVIQQLLYALAFPDASPLFRRVQATINWDGDDNVASFCGLVAFSQRELLPILRPFITEGLGLNQVPCISVSTGIRQTIIFGAIIVWHPWFILRGMQNKPMQSIAISTDEPTCIALEGDAGQPSLCHTIRVDGHVTFLVPKRRFSKGSRLFLSGVYC